MSDFFQRLTPKSIKGDIFGGVTTAIISLPMGLVFGEASGAGAEAGLYGAVIVGLFAALFGGSTRLISEPTGPMTVVLTAIIADTIAHNPEHGLAMSFGAVVIAGIFQIIFGVLKLGRYITMMPYSVISGFMSGIGVLLILLQLGPVLGQEKPDGGALGIVLALPELLGNIQWPEASLALLALTVLFFMPKRWSAYVPPHLIALLLGTAASLWFFGVDFESVKRIGEIPMGLPDFRFPPLEQEILTHIALNGLVLGMLGCIDTLLTAMIADSLTREQHDSDRELIGQGIGNTLSGFFGGLPGAGATMGTVVNIQVGATSPLAGVIRAVLLLLVIVAVAPLLVSIPLAVLSAIALKVGLDILDWSFLKRAHNVSPTATMIMYGVMALTVLVDLIVAVGVGVFIANILTIERLTKLQAKSVKTIDPADDNIPLTQEEKDLFTSLSDRVVLFHLSGPMIFGVASAISRQHAARKGADVLVLDLRNVPLLSTTVGLALENVVKDAREQGLQVLVTGASKGVRGRLERLSLTEETDGIDYHATLIEALKAAPSFLKPH